VNIYFNYLLYIEALLVLLNFVFHIPIDLSASTVLHGYPLVNARSKVGHIHYYSKDLVIATLRDCGFEIVHWSYSGAGMNASRPTLKTQMAMWQRSVLYAFHKDKGVRVISGYT